MDTARRLQAYLRPYWRRFAAGVAAMVMMALANLAVPYLFGRVLIDKVLGRHGSPALLGLLAGGVVALYLFKAIFSFSQQYLMSWVGQRLVADLRREVFEHLQDLPIAYHETHRTGESIARITNDVGLIQATVSGGVADLFSQALLLAGILAVVFVLHWRLAALTIIVFPVVVWVVSYAGWRIRAITRQVQERISDLTAVLQETLSAMRVVKAFTMEAREARRFSDVNEAAFGATMRSAQALAMLTPTVELLFVAALAFIMWYGGLEVLRGRLTTGELVAFFGYIGLATNPLSGLTRSYNSIQQALAAGDRVFEVLDQEPEVWDLPDAIVLPRLIGRVVFNDVTFAYGDAAPVLTHIDLDVLPGQVIALVGPSGAGKTSLVNLIPRFYDPVGGQVLVDGYDLRTVNSESLRRQIGLVPQETVLFGVSVRENILYGRPGATDEEIEAAARMANAHEFIMDLPKGYETPVGERGASLSGGQRQRIAIARALLRDPRILILDEATSALDAKSERLVQEALERLFRDRTTFVIAHRLSTIRFAHKIVVLAEGAIIESGTHDELLALGGLYSRLYARQMTPRRPPR